MKRRDFITATAWGSSFCAIGGLVSAFNFAHTEGKNEYLLDPIIPIKIFFWL